MGSNFSIFGYPSPSSPLKDSHNRDTIGNLKHRFETKNSNYSCEEAESHSPSDCSGGHQGIVKLKNKEFIGESFKLQDKTPYQLELVAASPRMVSASKFSNYFSDKIVKQLGSIEYEDHPEIEQINLKSPSDIQIKTLRQGVTVSFPESTSTDLHQLKRMRPSSTASRGSFFGDATEQSAEVNSIETNKDIHSNEENIVFSQVLVPREVERPNFEYSVGQGKYSQQILTSHHLFHECNGLASLQNTASCYDINPNNEAESSFQSKISHPQREYAPSQMLRMNEYMLPDGLPYPPHKSCQFFTAVAPFTREIHYEAANSGLYQPVMAADFPPKESELILTSGKNSSKRSSAKQLVDGVLSAVSRSSSKWKGEGKQVKPVPESAKESLHLSRNKEKAEHGRNGALIKRNLKARADHQARLASSPSGKDMLNGTTNKTWIPSSIDPEKHLLESAVSGNSVKIIHGYKVTFVDEENKVFIIDLVSPETCKLIRRLADDHCSQAEASGNLAASWRTLYTYSKMDLPCCEVKDLTNLANNIMAKVILIVGEIFGDRDGVAKLRPRSWKEPHLLKYQAIDGFPHHTGICEHYDGCDITWQVMLTDMNEYTGGGTYFRCNRKTIKLRLGQVLVHPGELYHKGVDITSGIRELLICFLDGFDPQIIDKSDPKNDSAEYEKNVIVC